MDSALKYFDQYSTMLNDYLSMDSIVIAKVSIIVLACFLMAMLVMALITLVIWPFKAMRNRVKTLNTDDFDNAGRRGSKLKNVELTTGDFILTDEHEFDSIKLSGDASLYDTRTKNAFNDEIPESESISITEDATVKLEAFEMLQLVIEDMVKDKVFKMSAELKNANSLGISNSKGEPSLIIIDDVNFTIMAGSPYSILYLDTASASIGRSVDGGYVINITPRRS